MKLLVFCLLWLHSAFSQEQYASVPAAQTRIRNAVMIAPGAICDNRVPAYFVIEGRSLDSRNYIVYAGIKESECVAICSDNMDLKGQFILCASFTYNSKRRKCYVYREVARPAGIMPLTKFQKGQRYYEKFCLPYDAPLDCGEKAFFREHQVLLAGFAKNVTFEASLEDCAAKCIMEGKRCKSAMYFYEESECIVNSESALTHGEFFVDEEVDRVVYFENGCLLDKQVRSKGFLGQKGAVISIIEERPEINHDDEISILISQEKSVSAEVTAEMPETTTTRLTTAAPRRPVTRKPPPKRTSLKQRQYTRGRRVRNMGPWGAWSFCDKPDGRRIRRRKCLDASKGCTGPRMESQWCSDLKFSERQTAPPSTAAPPVTRARHVVKPLRNIMPDVTGRTFLPGSAWGLWSAECLNFAFEQPCNNGRRLGFQNRQCNGFPFQCQGPFFRYCFMGC